MDIQAIAELDLCAAVDAEIAALLATAFDTEFGGRSYFRQRHHLRLIARVDGRLAGHVALTYRVIQMNDLLIPVLGLAEVATDPAFRGQGVARALIANALTIATKSDASFALLFGDPAHYSRYGFQTAKNQLRHFDLEHGTSLAVKTVTDPGFMVAKTGDIVWDDQTEVDLMGHMF